MAAHVLCAAVAAGTIVGPTNHVCIVEEILSTGSTGLTCLIIVSLVGKINTKTAKILIATAKSSTKSTGEIFLNIAPAVAGTIFSVLTLIAMALVAPMQTGPIHPSTANAKVGTKKHAKTRIATSRSMLTATGQTPRNTAIAKGFMKCGAQTMTAKTHLISIASGLTHLRFVQGARPNERIGRYTKKVIDRTEQLITHGMIQGRIPE